MQSKKSNWFPHAMAMYNVIVWGTTFISTKVLLESFDPLEILIYRFVIGYVALWCLQPKFLKWQGLKTEFAYFIAGLFGVLTNTICTLCMIEIFHHSEVGTSSAACAVFKNNLRETLFEFFIDTINLFEMHHT